MTPVPTLRGRVGRPRREEPGYFMQTYVEPFHRDWVDAQALSQGISRSLFIRRLIEAAMGKEPAK